MSAAQLLWYNLCAMHEIFVSCRESIARLFDHHLIRRFRGAEIARIRCMDAADIKYTLAYNTQPSTQSSTAKMEDLPVASPHT